MAESRKGHQPLPRRQRLQQKKEDAAGKGGPSGRRGVKHAPRAPDAAKAAAKRKVPADVAKAELDEASAQLATAKENVQQMEAQSRYVRRVPTPARPAAAACAPAARHAVLRRTSQ